MDNRYENLQPARIRKLGYVLLGMFAVLMLANNRAIYPVLEAGVPSNWNQAIEAAMCGVVFAQFSLLAVWSVLSPQPLRRRLLFLICAAVALIAAWTLGFATSWDPLESFAWRESEELFLFRFLPIVFLAHALPLMGLRLFWSTVLAKIEQVPLRRSVSIAGLLSTTGIIAFAFATIQLPTRVHVAYAEMWFMGGVAAGIAFAIGLLAVLPAVLLLFSRRRFFGVWSVLLPLYAAGIIAAIFGGLRSYRLSPPGSTLIFSTLLASTMTVIVIGIGIVRLLGYRLAKQSVKKAKAPVK